MALDEKVLEGQMSKWQLPIRLITIPVGIVVTLVGLVLWILPFVPGAPIFFFGLGLLMAGSPRGRAMLARWRKSLAAKIKSTRRALRIQSRKDMIEDYFSGEESNGSHNSE